MKKILLSLFFIYSIECLAQTQNPDLFQTWYLSSVQTDDGSMGFTVSDITPNISPSLTIMNDMTFNGVGACNTFDGEFNTMNFYPLETIQFENLTNDCGIILHNDFENEYFTFIQMVSDYTITPVENGLMLRMFTLPFGNARFFNYQLNTTEFDLQEIKIYPNPVKDKLFIKSPNVVLEQVNTYDLSGKMVFEQKDISNDNLDISQLQSGVYILKLKTSVGEVRKKLVKE